MAIVIVCGILANSEAPGPVFAGLRSYMRAVPFFFLPAVYAFSERQIRSQLLLLLLICVPQLPIAYSQRSAHLAEGGATGDTTTGTLMGSGLLSIFCVCAACVLTGMLLRKRIKLLPFLVLFILLILPTTINETKATLVFLPLGLLATFILSSERGLRVRNGMLALFLLGTFAAIFVPIYNYYINKRTYSRTPITEFFTNEDQFGRYMSKGSDVGAGARLEVGRLDAVLVPIKVSLRDPTYVAFGHGIGNASESSLGPQFTGRYFDRYEPFLQTMVSMVVLEMGIGGMLIALLCYWMIFKDSRAVAEEGQGLIAAVSVGWIGATAVMTLAAFYTTTPTSPALSYLFWYFSGLVAAERVRLALAQTSESPATAPKAGRVLEVAARAR
jgi:hypothetical protein